MIRKSIFLKIILIIATVLISSTGFTQDNEKTLLEQLDSIAGNDKIMLLNRLSDAVLYKSPQQSLQYGIQALELAKKDSNLYYLAESYLSIAYALRYQGEYKKALDSLYITVSFINNFNDKKLQSQILNLIGLIHQDLGRDTLSLENYIKSYDLSKEINDKTGMISTLNNLGNFYMNQGNYKKSTEYFFKCLKVYEEIHNEKGIAQMFNNIGTVYQKQGNYAKALDYHLKAYEIIKQFPDYKVGHAYVFNNLGACYINNQEYDKAAEYLLKSVSICKEIGLYDNLMANYNNLGIVFKEKGEYQIAINYLLEGLKLADKSGNKISTSKYLLNIADVYLFEKKYERSLSYFNRALLYNKELNDFYLLSENYYGIYENYKALNKNENALENLEDYLTYRDSLDNINNTKLVAEIEAQYELDKKEQRISTLKKDSRIQELELERKNTSNKILIYGISGLIFIIALIIYLFIHRIKLNRLLTEQNRQINDQNNELNIINRKLIKSEEELRKSNRTKDKFFSIIAHDLKNPLLALKSLFFSIKKNRNSLSQKDLQDFSLNAEDALNSVILLLNNLLHWARSQKDQIQYKEESVDIIQLLNNCIESMQKQAEDKGILIINNIEKDKFHIIRTDKNMLDFILRNILSNAIKFSFNNSTITINNNINHYYEIIINDQGTGISKEQLNKILSNSLVESMPGTKNESGTGLGLSLSKEFIEKMNGSLKIKSEQGNGSSFIIQIPIK